MQKPEPPYVPFEQILAFCEGKLSEAAAEQVRDKAIHNPLIQATITNLRSYLEKGSSQNLQNMIDQSLDQFLTQSLAESFQPAKDPNISKAKPSRIQLLPKSRKAWVRQTLTWASIVLILMLGYKSYQSLLFSGEAKETALIANDHSLNSPADLTANADGNEEVLNPNEIQKDENLALPAEAKETALAANDPSLDSPDDFTAHTDGNAEILNPDEIQKNESSFIPAEAKAIEQTANDLTTDFPDDLTADATATNDGMNPKDVQRNESLFIPTEAKAPEQSASDSTLVFPSGFTPNGDGNNDVFKPKLLRKIKVFHEFSIYNRWGEQVYTAVNFSSKSKKKEWDGTFKGEPAEEGTYVFIVRLKNALGFEETLTGDFVLIR